MKGELQLAGDVDAQAAVPRPGEFSSVTEYRPPCVADMLQSVIASGLTSENVAAFKELVQIHREELKLNAEKEFASAFVALQAEMPKVKATKPVPSNDGSIRYHFAPYEEIMKQVAPLLQSHGFTVTFSMDFKENRLVQTCTLQHVGGHSRSNTFAVRVGSGPPKASEAQADGAAATYCKRFALCSALNIVIGVDTDGADARVEGHPITPEQADELARRVAETNSDRAAFLKLAGASDFKSILSGKYDVLDGLLRRKEGKR